MALIGQIAISMTTNSAAFAKGLKTAGAELKAFGQQALSVGNILLGGLIGAGGIAGLYKMVEMAGHLEQQMHRVKVVFGDSSEAVVKSAKLMSDAFGVSNEEFLKNAASSGALFKNMGYSEEQASKLSVGFEKLAIDQSRLTGIPVADVMEKIQKGAAGSAKGLKDLGVYMNEDVVKAEALKLGLTGMGGQLSESAKIQARLSVISKQLSSATGEAGKTAETVMGRWEAFTGRLQNIAETISTILLPLIGPGAEMQVGLLGIQGYLDGVAESMKSTTGVMITGAQTQVQANGWIQRSISVIADTWWDVKNAFLLMQHDVTEGLGFLVGWFDKLSRAMGNLTPALKILEAGIGKDFFKTWSEDLKNLADKQLEDVNKKLTAPLPSASIDAWFQNARNKMAALRAEAQKNTLDLKAIGAPKEMAGAKSTSSSTAMVMGSQESTNAILKSKYGGHSDKTNQKIENNTAKTAEYMKKLADAWEHKGDNGMQVVWQDFG
jgi:hypothetical protein